MISLDYPWHHFTRITFKSRLSDQTIFKVKLRSRARLRILMTMCKMAGTPQPNYFEQF